MKIYISTISLIGFVALISHPAAHAGDSAQNASGASTHASQAVTMGLAASGQAVLGVVAVPMLSIGTVSGAAGAASTAAGKTSAAAAKGLSVQGSLPITDETITVTSPIEALKQRTSTLPR
jgi:hypothetical protein